MENLEFKARQMSSNGLFFFSLNRSLNQNGDLSIHLFRVWQQSILRNIILNKQNLGVS